MCDWSEERKYVSMYHVEKLEVLNCYPLSPDVSGFG